MTLTRPALQGVCQSILFDDLAWVRVCDANGKIWPIDGPMRPRPPLGEGVVLDEIAIKPIFKHLDQAGAHQVGVTHLDVVWDATEFEMLITFRSPTRGGVRKVFREWLMGWDPRRTCQMAWFTPQLGNWWIDVRQLEVISDKVPPGAMESFQMSFHARADFPWFRSFDSRSPVMTADSSGNLVDPIKATQPHVAAPTNFQRVTNWGDQPAFPVHLLQGPGTFTLGDNGGPGTVTIPVKAGQLVHVTTDPAVQTVTEINTGANLYPLIKGRFSQPVPAAPGGYEIRIPISVTGSQSGVTSALTKLTPLRRWPQ
ncbi:hypothetical protein [Nocardia sp. NPDC046763]|uniref:hypothetical protein n=1 Tax=Nocardia sp. NPDC046763 TaxID=3155256 RepID=UPI0033D586BC